MITISKSGRPAWQLPAIYGGLWFAVFAMLLLSVWAVGYDLREARGTRLDFAKQAIVSELTEPVALGESDPLRDAILRLQRDGRFGLQYLRVFKANGDMLARTGKHENSSELLRSFLYGMLSKDVYLDLVDSGAVVGGVQFGLGWFSGDGSGGFVQWAGVIGALACFALLAFLSFKLAWVTLAGAPQVRRTAGPVHVEASPEVLSRVNDSATVPANLGTQSLLAALGVGIVSVDRSGRVLSANPAAGKLAMRHPSELLRQPLWDAVHFTDRLRQPWQIPLAELLRGKVLEETAVTSTAGEVRNPVTVSAWPVRDSLNAIQSIVILMRPMGNDVTVQPSVLHKLAMGAATFSAMSEAVVVLDQAGRVTFANARASEFYGKPGDDLQGLDAEQLFPSDANTSRERDATLAGDRVVLRDHSGNNKEYGLLAVPLPESGAQLLLLRDTSRERKAQNLANRIERLLALTDEEILVFHSDTLRFITASNMSETKLGYGRERLRSMTLPDLCENYSANELAEHIDALKSGQEENVYFQTRFKRENGSEYQVEARLSYSKDEQPPVFVLIAEELAAAAPASSQDNDDRLLFLAFYDSLTGLPSRLLFMDRLQQELLNTQRADSALVVAILSLSGMKAVNARLGYETADKFLKSLASGLQSAVGDNGLVSRIGTDFVFMKGVSDAGQVDGDLSAVLDRATTVLKRSNVSLDVQMQMGYTLFPEDKADANGLLVHALSAVEASAQDSEPARIRQFIPPANEKEGIAEVHAGLLREALSREALGLRFYPVVHAESGNVGAVQVCLDWSDIIELDIGPDEFSALAQRTGLDRDLSIWMMRKTCEAVQEWSDLGMTALPMMVDFSLLEPFRNETIDGMLDIVEQFGLDREQLTFGVSQQAVAMQSGWLQVLRDAGVSILVTGMDSSTGEAVSGTVNYAQIKLVVGAGSSDQAVAQARASISQAKLLKATIVGSAECSDQGRQLLTSLGCRLFAKKSDEGGSARQFGIALSRSELEPVLTRLSA